MRQFHFPINTLTIALFVIVFTLNGKRNCTHETNMWVFHKMDRTPMRVLLFEGMDKDNSLPFSFYFLALQINTMIYKSCILES
jgi:hypothetical protein